MRTSMPSYVYAYNMHILYVMHNIMHHNMLHMHMHMHRRKSAALASSPCGTKVPAPIDIYREAGRITTRKGHK